MRRLRAIPIVVWGLVQATYTWWLNQRGWRWLRPRPRRVRATVTEAVETDRDGREFRRRGAPEDR